MSEVHSDQSIDNSSSLHLSKQSVDTSTCEETLVPHNISPAADPISIEVNGQQSLSETDSATENFSANKILNSFSHKLHADTSESNGKINKSDLPKRNAEISSLIVRQIEYYFSDANLLRDKFLQTELTKDDGWISLSTLLQFNRLKQMTSDPAFVLSSLEKSCSNLLELDHVNQKLRRNPSGPSPVSTKAELDKRTFNRTVFVDGFPNDSKSSEIVDFFVDKWHTDDVKLRKKAVTKEFLGSVFVVFSTEDAAKNFVSTEDVDFNENKLSKMSLAEFQRTRAKSLQEECKQDKKLQKLVTGNEINSNDDNVSEEEVSKRMIAGSVLFIDGLPEECTREILKEKFSDHARVYADYSRGDKQAWLRFEKENSAQSMLDIVLKENDNKLQFGNIIPSNFKVLKDNEELSYWKGVVTKIAEFKNSRKRARRFGKKGNNNIKRFKLAD